MNDEVFECTDFMMYVLRKVMEPGYLYGISKDGELYRAKVDMPNPGQTITLPPMYMPMEVET